jgi:hypothetical protein
MGTRAYSKALLAAARVRLLQAQPEQELSVTALAVVAQLLGGGSRRVSCELGFPTQSHFTPSSAPW